MKLVTNAGNGAAGHVIDAIEEKFKSIKYPSRVHQNPP